MKEVLRFIKTAPSLVLIFLGGIVSIVALILTIVQLSFTAFAETDTEESEISAISSNVAKTTNKENWYDGHSFRHADVKQRIQMIEAFEKAVNDNGGHASKPDSKVLLDYARTSLIAEEDNGEPFRGLYINGSAYVDARDLYETMDDFIMCEFSLTREESTIEETSIESSIRYENSVILDNEKPYGIGRSADIVSMASVNDADVASVLGNDLINTETTVLTKLDLPSKYFDGIDFSSFQAYMSYYRVTNPNSNSYKICYSDKAYTDEYGMRRYRVSDNQFSINGKDDYVVALGNFYKMEGSAGGRYLVVTTTGMYTCIVGDEKGNADTYTGNYMFGWHNGYAGMIEWIVDETTLDQSMKLAGTVTAGPIEPLKGEILYIYYIEDNEILYPYWYSVNN